VRNAHREIVTLSWGDVDEKSGTFRLRYKNVKGQIESRARTVQVPDWLMEAIAATCPREDRTRRAPCLHGAR
jgi:integrase